MLKLIDSHCHLESFDNLDSVIASSKEKLDALVTTGYDHESSIKTLDIAKKYPDFVYPVIGLAPQKAMKQEKIEMDIRLVRENPHIVAIGEIGLDYHWAKSEKEKELQRIAFGAFLDLALEMDLPVVIHSRDSHEEMIQTLVKKGIAKAMLHCFAGDENVAKVAVDNNYLISIPPLPSKNRKKAIKTVDLDFLVTETDAPAIGKEPLDVVKSAEIIARAKGLEIEEVARKTRENAIKFFNLKV